MSVAKAYVDTGLAELQRRLGDQGGLQVEEAYGGGSHGSHSPLRGHVQGPGGGQSWLTQSWLLLEWVQTNMGTTVAVDSQGGSDTQPQLPPDHTEPSPDGGAPPDSP